MGQSKESLRRAKKKYLEKERALLAGTTGTPEEQAAARERREKKRAADAAYYEANADRVCAKIRGERRADPESARQKDREQYANKRERISELRREIYRLDPESYKQRAAEYRKKNPTKVREWGRAYYAAIKNDPEKLRAWRDKAWASKIRRDYGLTIADYEAISAKQGHVCGICGGTEIHRKDGRLSVDHCHETNRVRGLLCHRCNVAIGLFEHAPSRLEKAIAYLRSS